MARVPDPRRPGGTRVAESLRILRILWIVLGAVLVLDALLVLSVVPLHSGVIATFALGGLYLAYGLQHGPPPWLRVLVPILTALMLLLSVSLGALGRMDTASGEEDAVVVLGAAVKHGDVTPALRARLDVAVDYSAANPDAVVVVAGGPAPGETVTEALAMQRYLVAHGVAEDRILQESRSTSTYENFAYAKELLEARFGTDRTTAFVTSDYHVPRAAGIAGNAEVRATHVHAATPWFEVPVDHVRELLAITKFAVTGR